MSLLLTNIHRLYCFYNHIRNIERDTFIQPKVFTAVYK